MSEYRITCLNGNHTFLLFRTEEEAITSMKTEPSRFINVEMCSNAHKQNLHRELYEKIDMFLARCIEMIEAQQSIGTYEI